MTQWQTHRRQYGWQLQRSSDGLARLVCPNGQAYPPTSIGKALQRLARETSSRAGATPNAAVFVHGLMGERETFLSVESAFSAEAWSLDFFRYPSHGARFDHHVRKLSALIHRLAAHKERLCLVGHSFGCRLIATALKIYGIRPIEVILIAPPVSQIKWAQRGCAIAPARAFLGGGMRELAAHPLDLDGLEGHRLLAIEGRNGPSGDGWLGSHETQMPLPHERRGVAANHSNLLTSTATTQAITAFLDART